MGSRAGRDRAVPHGPSSLPGYCLLLISAQSRTSQAHLANRETDRKQAVGSVPDDMYFPSPDSLERKIKGASACSASGYSGSVHNLF
ncbi:hypothetical protein BDW60DRAFT_190774 [Aspergillus nidulans var. acristatus]|jgi:hypothetical protein